MLFLKILPAAPGTEEFTWTGLKTPLLRMSKASWWHPGPGEATTEPHTELAVTVGKIFQPPKGGWGTL